MAEYEVELQLERTSRNKVTRWHAIWYWAVTYASHLTAAVHGTWAQERRARVHAALRLSTIAATGPAACVFVWGCQSP